jgi:thiol-disulfide isomerase/thioredoxin
MRRIVVVALGLLVLTALAATAAEKQLPSFTLSDLDGKAHSSESLIGGGPVLLNFWATWCKPCLAEQPKLKAFQAAWAAKGLRVLSISIDDPRTAKQVKPFVHRQGIEFPVYLDSNQEAYRKLGGRAVPFNVLVGSGGEVLSVTMGYKEQDAATWGALIEADLAARAEAKQGE